VVLVAVALLVTVAELVEEEVDVLEELTVGVLEAYPVVDTLNVGVEELDPVIDA